MDGADTFNQVEEYDGMPIYAILTDGTNFEFYCANFKIGWFTEESDV